MSRALPLYVQGIGLLGPGLASWSTAQAVLRGEAPHQPAPTVLSAPARLPPAERRRAGAVVRLTLAVADEAVAQAGADASRLATVFASSGGEGVNCHALCEVLAQPAPLVSPTRFTNSVHNAAAGYWHIAVASRAASTSLCAHDASLAAGLLEAACMVHTSGEPVLLVAYDVPYPEPLHHCRPIAEHFGTALLLAPLAGAGSLARLTVSPQAPAAPADGCADAALEALRTGVPAARALPLLQALARAERAALRLDGMDGLQVAVEVDPV